MVGNPQPRRPTLDVMRGSVEEGQHVRIAGQDDPIDVHQSFIAWAESETLTVSTSVVQITEDLRNYQYAFITVEDQTVRYWIDGTVPTASSGHRVLANDIIRLHGTTELERFRVIRQDGTDATLRVTMGSPV